MSSNVPEFPGEDDSYWTVSDLVDRWNCHRDTVYRTTDIPYLMHRGTRRYLKEHVLKWERENFVFA